TVRTLSWVVARCAAHLLAPKLCLGTQGCEALLRVLSPTGTGSRASQPAFPSSAWERGGERGMPRGGPLPYLGGDDYQTRMFPTKVREVSLWPTGVILLADAGRAVGTSHAVLVQHGRQRQAGEAHAEVGQESTARDSAVGQHRVDQLPVYEPARGR